MPHVRGEYVATLAWHAGDMDRIEITHGGRPVVTTNLYAQERGILVDTLRKEIQRAGVQAVAHLDARTPLYDPEQLTAMLAARPGRGAHLRKTSG